MYLWIWTSGDYSQMYSEELLKKLQAENPDSPSLDEIIKIMENGGWKTQT